MSPVGRAYKENMKKFIPNINISTDSNEINKIMEDYYSKGETPESIEKHERKIHKKHRRKKKDKNMNKSHHKSPKKIYSPINKHQNYDQNIDRPNLEMQQTPISSSGLYILFCF